MSKKPEETVAPDQYAQTQEKAQKLYEWWLSGCGTYPLGNYVKYERLDEGQQHRWAMLVKAMGNWPYHEHYARPHPDVLRFGDDRERYNTPEMKKRAESHRDNVISSFGPFEYDTLTHPVSDWSSPKKLPWYKRIVQELFGLGRK